jgi:molecular chaperone GrpE
VTAAGAEREPDTTAAEQPPAVTGDEHEMDAETGVSVAEAAGAAPAGPTTADPDATAVDAEPDAGSPEVRNETTIDLDLDVTAADTDPATSDMSKAEKDTTKIEKNADATDDNEVDAELDTLRSDLDELTRHLQRVTAEYANYRKRVDRDRLAVGEQATGAVLTALLPVLDDLDRARSHGDLVGPFAAVAEQLSAALAKFGLTPFGEAGDPFDPSVHEAVVHMSSADVTETTCVEVMRRGYQLGERLLRPALVAVADPADPQ